jgi:DNA-directed RNA polymerase subunit RPC12/RpoP
MLVELKKCSRCKKELPLSCFGKDNSRSDGLYVYCDSCRSKISASLTEEQRQKRREREAKNRAKNIDKARETGRRSYRKNREKRLAYSKAYHSAHRQEHRECGLRHKYGLADIDVSALLEKQRGKCAICGDVFPSIVGVADRDRAARRPHIDHEHGTGKVRGLLCKKHNTGLGFFDDSLLLLTQSVIYLSRYQTTPPSGELLLVIQEAILVLEKLKEGVPIERKEKVQ